VPVLNACGRIIGYATQVVIRHRAILALQES